MIPGSASQFFLGASQAASSAGGLQVSRSLRYSASDSSYLSRTPSVAGNRRTWTWSGWVKRGVLGTEQNIFGTNSPYGLYFQFQSDNSFKVLDYTGSAQNYFLVTSQVFRDPGAWLHIVFALDTTQSTANARVRLYINGVEVSAFATRVNPSLNYDGVVNTATSHTLGRLDSQYYFDGYLANIHFIDGQALTPTSFAETDATTGQWIPKAYSGTYGTNGFYLQFADNSSNTASTLGKDSSGLGNNWLPVNFSTSTGGPTSVATASGALPVWNTTDTYGATKGSGTRTDTNSASIVLALPMDGTNGGTSFGDQSATIKGSGSAKSVTVSGATTSTTQNKFYGSSGYFSSSSLSLASSTDFAPGTGDFTVEFWGYFSSVGPMFIVAVTNGLWIGQNGGNFVLRAYNVADLVSYAGSPSLNAWTHIAVTRQGTTARIFFNGSLVASATTSQNFAQGTLLIGTDGSTFSNGYMQDLRVYNGVAKYTGNFNPPSSTANPTIAAGNDSLIDSPTNYGTDTGVGGEVRGNYATLNPLNKGAATLANGNLDWTANGAYSTCQSSIAMSSGKWYCEFTATSAVCIFGLQRAAGTLPPNYLGQTADGWGYYSGNGHKYNNNSDAAYGATYTTGDVIGIAFDADAGTLTFYKNGTSQGQAYSGLTNGPYTFAIGTGSSDTATANFGQRPFAYTAPSGFKALCTQNLPAPLVTKSNTVMDVVLYNGNSSTNSITGLQFAPDFVWIKSRSAAQDHQFFDIVRGPSSNLYALQSNSTAAEGQYGTMGSLDTTGFTLSGAGGATNNSGSTYVAWAWDGGTSTVSNTQGSITSQVRANPTAGFSVVTYTVGSNTSQTIGHGLGVAPQLIIVKERNQSNNWFVYHNSIGNGNYLSLNTTTANTASNLWNSTSPTSTVFTIRSGGSSPTYDGRDHVAYCFSPVVGYSSMSSYTGNGSADGPFVYTGFRPRWVMIKRSDSASISYGWFILDTARNTYNVMNTWLAADSATSDGADVICDTLSNGFKIRTTAGNINTNAGTFIYAAFAEAPFNYSRAR